MEYILNQPYRKNDNFLNHYQNLTKRFLYVIEKTLYGESKDPYKIYEGEKING